MFKPRFSLLTLLLACACAVIVTFAGIMALIQHAAGNSVSGMVFFKTLVTVRDNYVEPVDSEKPTRIPLTLIKKASAKLPI